ncbi:Lsr2 family protein [Streptomyces sp. CS7]|uniref:histone-like nucleoid-structuring protein Lsr2 n=1 Tax=Streptomyces sp. CS-7 TaxID=2906769 RepID=UPI0021B3CFD4|nr:Lsr2 family protein [Streptomyces sp. CS-7]MCT6776073.1 Lsr2 family protein [Streptomyces sp. CS-7]
MAQRIVTTYTDDLTGEESEDVKKHTILVDGAGVEIDLNADSYDKLMDALKPFFQAEHATRTRVSLLAKAAGKTKSSAANGAGRQDTAEIRKWARENGHNVNDRGRIPAEIREAYAKANS